MIDDHHYLGSTEVHSDDEQVLLELTYYTSMDDIVDHHPHVLKLWTLRSEAVALAEALIKAA